MKTIEICGKKHEIDCNAFTFVEYKRIFKTGILKDMQFIQNYLIKQSVLANQLEEKGINEYQKAEQISEYMISETDEFICKVAQIAWILIYTYNEKIESYEKWLKSIELKVDDSWIAEVTEFAVDCFC